MNKLFASSMMAVLLVLPFTGNSAEPLNVKLGLWEITSDTQISGVPALPKELTDRMSPDQLAAMQAVLKSQTDKGPIHDVREECLTQKDLEEPFSAEDVEGCEKTVVTSTRTAQEMRLVCTGERKGSGIFKVNTPTPETMTADLELKVGDGAEPMTVTSRMTGKWLSADCGKAAEDDR